VVSQDELQSSHDLPQGLIAGQVHFEEGREAAPLGAGRSEVQDAHGFGQPPAGSGQYRDAPVDAPAGAPGGGSASARFGRGRVCPVRLGAADEEAVGRKHLCAPRGPREADSVQNKRKGLSVDTDLGGTVEVRRLLLFSSYFFFF
jgi:hypothetical protein